MKKNALYFPYINVPSSSFLLETLIYWDKLSSIVPYEFREDPSKLSKRMRELNAAGLVEYILPLDYFSELKNFEETFITIASLWKEKNHTGKFKTSKIHIEKLGDLRYKLIDLKLAKENTYPWVYMPTPLADIFMAHLATELGKLPNLNATPITDMLDSNQNKYNISIIRQDILNDILPIPQGRISIDDIVKFKNDFGHLTSKFRNKIEEECIGILSSDTSYREEKIYSVKERLQDEINGIADSMNSSWKDISFKSIVPLMNVPLIDDFTNPLKTIILTGLASVPPIYEGISTYNKTKGIYQKPLAYATITKDHLYSKFISG